MGVAVGDYDNDGYEDVFVAGVNRNQLFHNNGDGTFTDVTVKAGLEGVHPRLGKTWSISAGWFDYDNDGYLDLLVVNYVQWSPEHEPACFAGKIRGYCSPSGFEGEPSMLFHNNGDGTFTDVSEKSGIGKHVGKGMGVAFADYRSELFAVRFRRRALDAVPQQRRRNIHRCLGEVGNRQARGQGHGCGVRRLRRRRLHRRVCVKRHLPELPVSQQWRRHV